MSNSPYWPLASGVFLLLMAATFTWTGKVWLRFKWIRRADEPELYWLWIAIFYLLGLTLVAVFFSQVRAGR